MSTKWGTRLAVLATAGLMSGFGLLTAGAGTAMADTPATPGTTGAGSWQFLTFDQSWAYTDGIQTTEGTPVTAVTGHNYQATVKPPINAPGQIPSTFPKKSRTIPVKYVVQRQDVTTTTTPTSTVYPFVLSSDSTGNPDTVASNLYWNAPDGLTVADITNLTADFLWSQGNNHGGSLRWQIDTTNGVTIYVYYGDTSDSFQSGNQGSGVNMMAQADARFEQQGGTPYLGTLADVLARPVPGGGTIGSSPLQSIGLVVDAGWGGGQAVQLLASPGPAVTIGTTHGTSTYQPGNIQGETTSDPVAGPWVADTSTAMYLHLYKVSGQTPVSAIDEALITNTQGDLGGQFRVVDGMYMYNLPLNQLPDLTATYEVGITTHSDGSNPLPTPVQFGLK